MLPYSLIALGIFVTLVACLPARWIRALCFFAPTAWQRAAAIVLGSIVALVGVAYLFFTIKLVPTSGKWEQPSTVTLLRSLNSKMDDELRKTWEELKEGRIAYESSRSMREGSPEVVRVRISRGDTIDTKSGFGDAVWVERLKVSGFMTASLHADVGDFEIVALSSESQALVGDFTDWLWQVTPLRVGDLVLMVRVTARIRLSDGSSELHDLLVKDARISVTSNPRWRVARFWGQNWQWILGSPVVVGVLTWIGTKIVKRRRAVRPSRYRSPKH